MRERAPLVISQGMEVRGFLIESKLGSGSFGTVFRASRGERRYALKFLRRQDAGGWARREVEMLLRVSHRNVVGFEGCGFWPDDSREHLVVIMDYVEGRQLDVWAQEENPDARQVARTVLCVARALAELHRGGICHRDLKEPNIIVRASDEEAVLVDLGVAGGANTAPATRGVLPPCTPEYRAPEAWRFLRNEALELGMRYQPGPADDLYALGVVLYWLLTGRKPCVGVTMAEQIEATLHQIPVPPHAVNPRVPAALSAICLKLLEKQPGDRYPDAGSLETAVEAELARADEAWSVPLCDAHAPDNVTTEGFHFPEDGLEEVDHRLRVARHAEERPRRGRRPEPAAPEAAPALPAPAASPVPDPQPSAKPARWAKVPRLLPVAVLVLGLVGLAVAWRALFAVGPETAQGTTWKVGGKVAPPWKPPEADRSNFYAAQEAPLVEVPPVSPKGEPSMKNPEQKLRKGLGPIGKAAATGTACISIACTGPQVRPEPPAEPCPVGALEAMAKLRIKVGDRFGAILPGPIRSIFPVREGWISVRLNGGFGDLPPDTIVSGRLIFGESRVYGRFTEAREPEGPRTWPICMELRDTSLVRGLKLMPGSTEDTARVWSSADVKAVDHFE